MEGEDPKLNFEESDNESEIDDINNDSDNDSVYEEENNDDNDVNDEDEIKADDQSNVSEKDIENDVDIEDFDSQDQVDDMSEEDDLQDDGSEEEDDSDDSDDEDEKLYLFDDDLKQDMIQNSHTLLKVSNMSEIKTLSAVTRNIHNQIVDEHHRTIPILTKYEKAKILGVRGGQLNNGCKAFVETTDADIDGYLIAEKELYEKKIPFIIKRPLPSGNNEYWNVNDLELII